MMKIDYQLTLESLVPCLERLFELSAGKIRALDRSSEASRGTPVFTVQGLYTSRRWTDWTQGFQFGSALLQYDATGDPWFLDYGRRNTLEHMAPQVSHAGVHDHGFNNISTYGNLLRLAKEGKLEADPWERHFYELALKASGAVQAARWARTHDGRGYIYSFNGPHSLFADTIRSLRSLAVAHRLGHVLLTEMDRRVSLLERLIHHASVTADYNVYYGEGRDAYDLRGRVAHESIFNVNDGSYRCPSTQQGYSPFSTWARGLAWIMCGYAEQLEFLSIIPPQELESFAGFQAVEAMMLKAAEATCDFYLDQTTADGIPYWDTAAPGLEKLEDPLERPSDPYNEHEPVDSSAACIAAQGLWRLGTYLQKSDADKAARYRQAALTAARTLFHAPYLSEDPGHQGLILHSVYHRPRGWDHVPPGRRIPCGESSMWGDYHARELALLLLREVRKQPYLTFFAGL